MMRFQIIAFDADDTLWHNERNYQNAKTAWADLLTPYGLDPEAILPILHRIEIDNLAAFGFGIKGFTLSMVEAAVEATGGKVEAADIQAIVEIGRAMTRLEVALLEYSAETVATLAKTHRLMLITKGDLMDQERKLALSGLESCFGLVEILSDKTPEAYARLLNQHNLAPERFLMVGNSMRSDILPVLALGGWAVYVPYPLTWSIETGEAPEANGRFYEIDHLGQLPGLVAKLERDDSQHP